MGNTAIGCELADYCLSGKHTCDANATCYYTGPQEFKCVVSTQARQRNMINCCKPSMETTYDLSFDLNIVLVV